MGDNFIDYIFLMVGVLGLLFSEFAARVRTNAHQIADKSSKKYKKTLNTYRIICYTFTLFLTIIGLIRVLS